MSLLAAQSLHVSLEGTPILRGLSFEIEAGAWIGLVGPNGSGKTTLLRTIAGLLPYVGTLHFDGRSLSSWRPRALAQRVAFLRQATPLTFDFTVEELVLLGRLPHQGWLEAYSKNDRQHVHEALEHVDLGGFAQRSVLSLSGGERQRAFLAQALVQETDLLLLDEPTTHLDVHYQFEFLDLVHDSVRAGRTCIAVFHDLELAARYADHVLVLQNGALVASGAPTGVLTQDLLAEVFRMDARLSSVEDTLVIQYVRPIGRNG